MTSVPVRDKIDFVAMGEVHPLYPGRIGDVFFAGSVGVHDENFVVVLFLVEKDIVGDFVVAQQFLFRGCLFAGCAILKKKKCCPGSCDSNEQEGLF